MKISIVIAAFNEEENVVNLHSEISSVLKDIGQSYEIIFVDDGSKDRTVKRLVSIDDPHLVIIRHRKNFGQTAGWKSGFDHAKGELIITLDADLQNDPRDIPKLLAKLDKGYDCVSGWRVKRKDTLLKHLFSRVSNFLRHKLINDQVNDSGCSLKAYRRECLEGIELYGEMHRYIMSLVALKGFRIGEVKVNHRSRKAGQTKYGLARIYKGFIDLLGIWFWQKYAGRPMHLFGMIGILISTLGVFSGVYSVYLKIFRNADLSSTFLPTVAVFAFMLGFQFFMFGILADIMIKNYNRSVKKKGYGIKEIIDKSR